MSRAQGITDSITTARYYVDADRRNVYQVLLTLLRIPACDALNWRSGVSTLSLDVAKAGSFRLVDSRRRRRRGSQRIQIILPLDVTDALVRRAASMALHPLGLAAGRDLLVQEAPI